MKKFLLVLVAVLLVSTVAYAEYNPLSFKNKEPNGFRCLKWGTELSAIGGMRVIGEEKEKMLKLCIREGDRLRFGSAKLKEILYIFWNDKLWAVYMSTSGYQNAQRLKKAAYKAFGKPYKDPRGERYYWSGKRTGIVLEILSEAADFALFSVAISEQREAFLLSCGGVFRTPVCRRLAKLPP